MKDSMELMRERHSVRQYLDKKIPVEIREQLDAYAAELNAEGELHMQLIYDEPACFNSRMAHYGRFENCSNYIAMIGGTLRLVWGKAGAESPGTGAQYLLGGADARKEHGCVRR